MLHESALRDFERLLLEVVELTVHLCAMKSVRELTALIEVTFNSGSCSARISLLPAIIRHALDRHHVTLTAIELKHDWFWKLLHIVWVVFLPLYL